MATLQTIPSTMKAWSFSRRGQPLQVLNLSTLPVPTMLGATEVLVKVSHSSLNPFGYTMIWLVPAMMRKKPSIPEFDFAGRIVKTGDKVREGIKLGDDVFGMVDPGSSVKLGRGTLCEYLVIDSSMVALKPKAASFEAAAGFAVAGVTAAVLMEKSGLKAGDSVFVNGGSGGVGLTVVQMAKDIVGLKGRVVATCSAANAEMVKSVGADEVIDYHAHKPLPPYLISKYSSAPFSAIIDTVGQSQPLYNRSPVYLAPGKPFLCIGSYLGDALTFGNILRSVFAQIQNTMWPRFLGGTPRPWIFVNGEEGGLKALDAVKTLFEEGKLDVVVDSVYEMENALEAYARIMSRRAKGKVIIKVQEV